MHDNKIPNKITFSMGPFAGKGVANSLNFLFPVAANALHSTQEPAANNNHLYMI